MTVGSVGNLVFADCAYASLAESPSFFGSALVAGDIGTCNAETRFGIPYASCFGRCLGVFEQSSLHQLFTLSDAALIGRRPMVHHCPGSRGCGAKSRAVDTGSPVGVCVAF